MLPSFRDLSGVRSLRRLLFWSGSISPKLAFRENHRPGPFFALSVATFFRLVSVAWAPSAKNGQSSGPLTLCRSIYDERFHKEMLLLKALFAGFLRPGCKLLFAKGEHLRELITRSSALRRNRTNQIVIACGKSCALPVYEAEAFPVNITLESPVDM